jgi:hypothetical protein
MRLAWFRPATHVSEQPDDTAALVGALGAEHEIALFDEAHAHDFIRLDFRAPFDLCVYEVADTRQHAFVWPYLLHVPGVLRLRSLSLHDSRTASLQRQHRERDRALELAFGDWDLITAPVLASRMTVVSDAHAAARLQRAFPVARVRVAPLGVGWAEGTAEGTAQGTAEGTAQGIPQGTAQGIPEGPSRVGALDSSRDSLIQRAIRRARDAGADVELIADSAESVLENADILVAVTWPPADELTMALAGMAAGRAVVVLETESTAGWPALDPQTWQPRGWTGQPPIVVSIDPRDEEHSLALALRRLAADAQLRTSLGSAAHKWWQQHATLEHARQAWRSILAEAVTVTPPPRPPDWPRHLTADGTERAREVLAEFGATVDFLR